MPEASQATGLKGAEPEIRTAPVDAAAASPLAWTGERFIPTEGGSEIYYEHAHRYLMARTVLAGVSVVDLASGEGYGAAWLAEVAQTVVGIDIDAASVHHARRKYGEKANLRFAQGDIQEPPLADGCADAVTCFEAIEHVPDPRRVLEETLRILKPGGLFLVSTPNKALYTDARDYTNEFHVHEFYLAELEELLEEFFPGYVLLGQRVIAGSLTWPLRPATGAAGADEERVAVSVAPGFEPDQAVDPESAVEPLYVVALCRAPGDPVDTSPFPDPSVLVDPEELLLDAYRQAIPPAEWKRLHLAMDRRGGLLEDARREVQELRRRLIDSEHQADYRRQQRTAMRLSDDLQASMELNERLVAELHAAQRSIVQWELASRSPLDTAAPDGPAIPPQPTSRLMRAATPHLVAGARHLLAHARRSFRSA